MPSSSIGARWLPAGRFYELRKARDRAHVLEGQTVALANIDEVIALIKTSASPAEAKAGLIERIWQPGDVTAMLEKAGVKSVSARPDDLEGDYGISDDGYRFVAGPGPGDPGSQAAPPDRPGAG